MTRSTYSAEAELGRSLNAMREELKALKQAASSSSGPVTHDMLRAPVGSLQIATDIAEVLPEAPDDPPPAIQKGDYVAVPAPGAKVHIRRRDQPSRTWCNWLWTRQPRAQVHLVAPAGNMCIRCTRAHLRQCDEDSESSDSSFC